MLILTRKAGESLYIGDDIKITVVEVKGPQIRVGVAAPREFRIFREEIFIQIQEENKEAAMSDEKALDNFENFGVKSPKSKHRNSRVGTLTGLKTKK